MQQLKALSRPLFYADGVEPTELSVVSAFFLSMHLDIINVDACRYPLRKEADDSNFTRLANLPPPTQRYISSDEVGYANGSHVSTQRMQKLLEQTGAVQSISLKVGIARISGAIAWISNVFDAQIGAQVMLIKVCTFNQVVSPKH